MQMEISLDEFVDDMCAKLSVPKMKPCDKALLKAIAEGEVVSFKNPRPSTFVLKECRECDQLNAFKLPIPDGAILVCDWCKYEVMHE